MRISPKVDKDLEFRFETFPLENSVKFLKLEIPGEHFAMRSQQLLKELSI